MTWVPASDPPPAGERVLVFAPAKETCFWAVHDGEVWLDWRSSIHLGDGDFAPSHWSRPPAIGVTREEIEADLAPKPRRLA